MPSVRSLALAAVVVVLAGVALRADPIADANASILVRRQVWEDAASAPRVPGESEYDRIVRILGDGVAENVVIRGAHNNATGARSNRTYYSRVWDLSDIPSYTPGQQVSGTLRISGGYLVLGSVAQAWKKAFAKYQPGLTIEATAAGALVLDQTDIQTGPRMADRFDELSAYEAAKKHPVFEINWATGSYDVPGWSPAIAIFVQKDNPLKQLTVAQLDGIFGGARRGGWTGTSWHTDVARGPERNIRTWGDLGLTGEWADKPIHVYGRPLRNYNIQRNFEREVLRGGDLWNDNLREYAHEVNPDGTRYISSVEMVKDLGKDKYGIAFSDLGSLIPEVKLVSVAPGDHGPYVELTLETLRQRTYPLFLAQWAEVNCEPGKPLDPKLKEFLRFMLSREGQQAIQEDGKWLPLPASEAIAQLKKLDSLGEVPAPGTMGLHQREISSPLGEGDGVDEHGSVDPKRRYYEKGWDLSDLPEYAVDTPVSGVIRLPSDGYLMQSTIGEAWISGFCRLNPGVSFKKVKRGGLDTGKIDLQAGRKWLAEYSEFDAKRGHPPLELQMATGSVDVPGWSPALAILVHASNPISHLSLQQLDGTFAGARRGGWVGNTWRREIARGPEKNIRTWGELGLTGEWADKPIHVYARPLAYSIMRVFETRVFSGGNIWNDSLREYPSRIAPDGSLVSSAEDIVAAMEGDPYAITFCDVGSANLSQLKPVALSASEDGPYADFSRDSVRGRSYPLALPVYAYVDLEPGKAPEPALREFLRYILSRQGQQAIQGDGKWLPLTAEQVAAERSKLP